jgi:LEA14-like dessication related protein
MKSFSLTFALLILFLSGCASINSDYEQPKVDLVGISKSETDTAALQFTLQLNIVNPNAETMNLRGLYYELSLDGIEVIRGTAQNIPPIEGYNNAIVSVSSSASLVNSVRLATRLMNTTGNEIPYELRTKLGTTSKWLPATTVTETGTIPLR